MKMSRQYRLETDLGEKYRYESIEISADGESPFEIAQKLDVAYKICLKGIKQKIIR